jgi:hypothetical protein
MTDDKDKLPENEAEDRFNKLVGNLVNTPHKPHKAPPDDRQPTSRGSMSKRR